MSQSQAMNPVGLPPLRLRATVRALRKTSGITTALPRFSTIPPSWSVGSDAASRLKSRWLVAPSAAPSAVGCWWMMSAPSAACTVTGMPQSAAPSNTDTSGAASLERPLRAWARASPSPCAARAPAATAAFMSRPVSSAMPKVPSARPAATSSLVPPYAASSKSWMAALPLSARWVITPRRISSRNSGPSPTLMTCPPSIATTPRRPAACASCRMTARRSFAARTSGRESRKALKRGSSPGGAGRRGATGRLCWGAARWGPSSAGRSPPRGNRSLVLRTGSVGVLLELERDLAERELRLQREHDAPGVVGEPHPGVGFFGEDATAIGNARAHHDRIPFLARHAHLLTLQDFDDHGVPLKAEIAAVLVPLADLERHRTDPVEKGGVVQRIRHGGDRRIAPDFAIEARIRKDLERPFPGASLLLGLIQEP